MQRVRQNPYANRPLARAGIRPMPVLRRHVPAVLPAPGGSLLFTGSTGHDGPMTGEVLLPGGARRGFTATRRPA